MEREKIAGPRAMECEKIGGLKAVECEKILGPTVLDRLSGNLESGILHKPWV